MSIIIKHIVEESKFTIIFDMQDGSISFPSLDLNIEGDIDLSTLITKLSEFIEQKKKLQIEFEGTNDLEESNHKIKLVKETLNEIYNKFNEQVVQDDSSGRTHQENDNLPF